MDKMNQRNSQCDKMQENVGERQRTGTVNRKYNGEQQIQNS